MQGLAKAVKTLEEGRARESLAERRDTPPPPINTLLTVGGVGAVVLLALEVVGRECSTPPFLNSPRSTLHHTLNSRVSLSTRRARDSVESPPSAAGAVRAGG